MRIRVFAEGDGMARRSKKGSQGKQAGNKQSLESNVANLIESRRKQEEVSNTVEKSKTKHKTKTKKNKQAQTIDDKVLLEQFSAVLQKFETPKHANVAPKRTFRDENAQLPQSKVVVDDQDDNATTQPSKRKLRKLNKPSLVDLKSQVTHPEIIEWYDCDAPYPYLNATIKSTKNVVRVPSHWQTKREYLSGRSLLNKKPFELPDIMKQTDIETMRSVLPGEDPTEEEEQSIKGMSRARIQPKLGTLDIDFKKLYDIFFKLGSTWKPDVLLPFGDLYFENRNLHEESEWRKVKRSIRPGKISKNLREIMGLKEGQLPPWCHKMQKLGIPPSYPNMKVAGLNWDIQFMKNDIYGKVPKSNDKKSKKNELFGQILNFEEQEDSSDEEEGIKEKEEEGEESLVNEYTGSKNKKLITEIEVPSRETKPDQDFDNEFEKPLYTILKESANETSIGQTKTYSIPGHTAAQQEENAYDSTPNKDEEEKEEQTEHENVDELKNFKF